MSEQEKICPTMTKVVTVEEQKNGYGTLIFSDIRFQPCIKERCALWTKKVIVDPQGKFAPEWVEECGIIQRGI